MRVVIDTNIWVSGLLWRGMPWRLLRLAETGQVELCTSPSILSELAEVLDYERFHPRLRQLGLTPEELIAYAINLATIFETLPGKPIVVDDPDDDIFIHCAVAAGAAYVVSGDHHLLDLGEYAGIPILSIRDFLTFEFPDQVD